MQFAITAGGSSVPVGMYKAKFAGVEETPPHVEYGAGVKFRFTIINGDHAGEETSVICGTAKPASPKNRLGRVLGGLAGNPVQPGQTINVETLVGREYLIQVESAPSGTGTRVGTIMPSI